MVEDSTAHGTSIKVIIFKGKALQWPTWKEKYLARARRKGYKEIYKGTVEVPDDDFDIDASAVDAAELTDAREKNELAYEDLILAIDDETDAGRVAFSIVRMAKTRKLKDGDARLAWSRLCDKYESKSAPSRLNLKSKFAECKLANSRSDPDVWLTKLGFEVVLDVLECFALN